MEGGVVSDDVRQLVVDGVEALARRELEPHGAAWDRDAAFPEHVFATWAEHGLLSLALPEARGGVGLPLPDRLAVLEAIARTDASVALVVATHALAMEVAAMVGRLEEVGEGEVWSVVVPRREAGCVWTPTGDGAGVLAGALGPAVLAERADAVVVFANDGPRHRVFVVRRGTWAWEDRGVRVGLAMRAARVVHSDVDAAIVPADAWGGVVDEAAVARVLAMAHLSVAAIGLGLGRAALADACRHARARVQFGQPIATFQAIGRKVADMGTTLEAAALLVDAAARHVERGGIAAEAAAARASAFATRHARVACADCLQIHGGSGYTCDFPVERRLRDARWCGAGLVEPRAGRAAIVTALSRHRDAT